VPDWLKLETREGVGILGLVMNETTLPEPWNLYELKW
jgi:hypothetical protein